MYGFFVVHYFRVYLCLVFAAGVVTVVAAAVLSGSALAQGHR
jgi:hypothetical protein